MIRITSGTLRGRLLKTPPPSGKKEVTRPTSEKVRTALFNILGETVEGSRFLDLCAGSGAVGLEALSRGAKEAVFIEEAKKALLTLKENISQLQQEPFCQILGKELFIGLAELEKEGRPFDIIFFDPPYEFTPHKAKTDRRDSKKSPSITLKCLEWLDKSRLIHAGTRLFIEEGGPFQSPLLLQFHHQKVRIYGTCHLFEFTCCP